MGSVIDVQVLRAASASQRAAQFPAAMAFICRSMVAFLVVGCSVCHVWLLSCVDVDVAVDVDVDVAFAVAVAIAVLLLMVLLLLFRHHRRRPLAMAVTSCFAIRISV